jgi:glycosyltransferase involved in cell wall biosynthesis
MLQAAEGAYFDALLTIAEVLEADPTFLDAAMLFTHTFTRFSTLRGEETTSLLEALDLTPSEPDGTELADFSRFADGSEWNWTDPESPAPNRPAILSDGQRLRDLVQEHSALKVFAAIAMRYPASPPELPPPPDVRSTVIRETVAALWSADEEPTAWPLHLLRDEAADPALAASALSLAHWHASTGAFNDAAELLDAVDPAQWEKDDVLLACVVWSALGQQARAEAAAAAGIARFGALCDLRLAAARATGRSKEAVAALDALWRDNGLTGVRLKSGGRTAFDALRAKPVTATGGDGPLVSVIMPVYNCAKTLSLAVQSLLRQSWVRLEILIVDDGSTDRTLRLARLWARWDPRVRVIALDLNCGAYVARNRGFAEAEGEFVTVLDGDDWAHPERIERQVRALIGTPAAVASMTNWVRATEDLAFTRWRHLNGWVYHNVSSLMIRRSLRDEIGYWDLVRVGADSEYFQRIVARYGRAAIVDVCPNLPLSIGRSTETSLTGASTTHLRTLTSVGLRKNYALATARWHDRTGSSGPLYMPQFPLRRTFDAPDAIVTGKAEPALRAPDDILRRSPLFDEMWYREAAVVARRPHIDAAHHYWLVGGAETIDPGPAFSTSGYRMAHLGDYRNPLYHYETEGRRLGLSPLPRFAGSGQDASVTCPVVALFGHMAGKTLFGAERSLLDMARRLVAKGRTVEVILPEIDNRPYLDELLALARAVHILPMRRLRLDRPEDQRTVELLTELLARIGAKECHVNTLTLRAPLMAARVLRIPGIVHVRELPAEDPLMCMLLGGPAEDLRDWLLRAADRFVANSPSVADWIDCSERTIVQPNSVSPGLFALSSPVHRAPLRFGIVGAASRRKGIEALISAATALREDPRAAFVVVGPGAGPGAIPPNLRCLGYRARPEDALAEVDVLLSLSDFAESFGRTVLEGMAAGRPVICFDRGHPPVLVRGAGAGLVVPPNDTASLVAAIRMFCDDPALFAAASVAGRAAARRAHESEDGGA